jgi:peptidoglycan/LPS O-acetylase OafA/YrhL
VLCRKRGRFRPEILALLCIPSLIWLRQVEISSMYTHWIWFSSFDFLTAALLAPALIYAARPHSGNMARGSKPLLWLGERSYGLYLWHFPIILSVYGMGPLVQPADTSAWAGKIVLIAVLSLLAAHLSYVLIERPAQEKARRWLRRTPPGSTPVPVTHATPNDLTAQPAGR